MASLSRLCRVLVALVVASVAAPVAHAVAPVAYDLIVRDATIVDGTGKPAFRGDLAVRGGRIVLVGRVPAGARAGEVVQANGRVLAPGFIDAHAHGDPLVNKSFANFVSQGVTTIVLGQDGSTPGYSEPGDDDPSLGLAEWAGRAEAQGLELNIAPLVGHGSLRWEAGVGVAPEPTAEQMAAMKRLLKRDLDAGAFGMSSGLEYPPGLYSAAPEMVELAKVVGAADGVIVSHMRSEDTDKVDAALDELIAQGKYARVQFSHMKVVLGHGPAQGEAIIARMKAARARGVRIGGDAYPYLAGSASIELVFPPWAKTREQFALAMKTRRPELEAFVRRRIEVRNGPGAILILSGPNAGKTLEQAAAAAGKPFWIYALDDMGVDGPNCAHFVMDAELQDVFLTSDIISISTDGAPWMAHPRSWGTYSRILEEYVGKRRALTLEQAVRKMSGLAAENIGLKDRGRIAPGMRADLVLFDPARVRSKASWTEPEAMSEGFDLVLVNGVAVFRDGAMTGARPGKILKRGRR